ncbi:prolipoprotein diacylglyceryl transferase [Candidatus Aerophobetes bacterium]|uniref:Phosphatidylglycerol--prolipoprotein diacylglyceryl transferase n=1 Tax=Aerophobetes bacterium TaxID=2030807 RepID=A0A2A4YLR4_UNCAE|nr:MAG: prolipoprotein diacylglyceryl transferase [Candidatus Aerophobetes bacterium]
MLAAIYWNPSREIFTIPFIDRPIAWYGVFFALGFLIGYFILLHVFRGYLLSKPFFLKGDIKDFARFLMTLRNKQNHPFLKEYLDRIPVSLKEQIQSWDLRIEVDESFKNSLINSLNEYMRDAPSNIKAKIQHESLPFLKNQSRNLSEGEKRSISFRLLFEKFFPESLVDLNQRAKNFTEKLTVYTIIATIIGSRLGHILFYEDVWHYLTHPIQILKTWEGGLASHGGAIAIAVAFVIFIRKQKKNWPNLSVLRLIDLVAIPTCFAAVLIRVGNFFNQEIIGHPTSFFLGIIFGDPMEGGAAVMRHPAQLYEAALYLVTLVVLSLLVRNQNALKFKGRVSGYFFLLIFGLRFFVEYIKEEQSVHALSFLNMGQLLSIPGALLGVFILVYMNAKRKKRSKLVESSS